MSLRQKYLSHKQLMGDAASYNYNFQIRWVGNPPSRPTHQPGHPNFTTLILLRRVSA